MSGESALIAIDVQGCFLPGGSLPTGNARNANHGGPDMLGKKIAESITEIQPTHLFITKDWHTEGHSSFITNAQRHQSPARQTFPEAATNANGPFSKNTGVNQYRYSARNFVSKRYWGKDAERKDQKLWPEHCVQGSDGANVVPSLLDNLPSSLTPITILKGDTPDIDSYSIIADALGDFTPHDEEGNSFISILTESAITTVYVTGIARDVCVFWSAMDLLNYWILPAYATKKIKLVFMYDLTRPVYSGGSPYTDITPSQLKENVMTLIASMKDAGKLVTEDDDATVYSNVFEIRRTESYRNASPSASSGGGKGSKGSKSKGKKTRRAHTKARRGSRKANPCKCHTKRCSCKT